MLERMSIGPEWRAAVVVGVLGSFTTFSTFSLETLYLIEQGEMMRAMANIALSVLLCLAAVWLGVFLGRQL
jgi:CrcB protein